MSTPNSRRIQAAAGELNAGWALLSSAESVTYSSGHIVPIETGSSPFAGGASLVIVGPDGVMDAVVSNLEAASAASSGVERVHDYVGFSAGQPENYLEHYLRAFQHALDASGAGGRVAVESASVPWKIAQILEARGIELVDGSKVFARARMIKSETELVKLRESARLAALAQQTAIAAAEVGMTELELFSLVRGAVELDAGERVAFAGDLLSGAERTSGVGGWATARKIERGDMILADLAPRVGGYWSDSANTFVLGRAGREFGRMHDLAQRALQAGIAAARPGVPVNIVDHAVRSVIAAEGFEYGHHTGHGIGTSVHEFPRIIPGETTPLEQGMVILLEPGVYQQGVGGVRLEWMFEVGEAGLIRITDFEHDLQPR